MKQREIKSLLNDIITITNKINILENYSFLGNNIDTKIQETENKLNILKLEKERQEYIDMLIKLGAE